jgi:hypothetical protein
MVSFTIRYGTWTGWNLLSRDGSFSEETAADRTTQLLSPRLFFFTLATDFFNSQQSIASPSSMLPIDLSVFLKKKSQLWVPLFPSEGSISHQHGSHKKKWTNYILLRNKPYRTQTIYFPRIIYSSYSYCGLLS